MIILDYFKVKSVDNDLWFVAHRNTEIQPGDVLKLGRIQMEFISVSLPFLFLCFFKKFFFLLLNSKKKTKFSLRVS